MRLLFNKLRLKISRILIRHFYGLFSSPHNRQQAFAVIGHLAQGIPYAKQYLGSANFRLGKKILSNTPAVQKKLTQDNGMLIITEKMLIKGDAEDVLMVPTLIWLTIPLPPTFDEFKNNLPKSARSDISRIRREGYTHTLINDAAWVETFFKDYHLPSMQQRHKRGAYITQVNALTAQLKRAGSEFINIYAGDVCVASMLTTIDDGKYTLSQMGWLNGDAALVYSGAVAALYWYAIQRAYQLGCKEIILGGTPAHIDNGVIIFKAKWGARISKQKFQDINYLRLNPAHPACREFLKSISLIAIGKDGKLILLTSKKPDELKVKDSILKDISRWYTLRENAAKLATAGELPTSVAIWYDEIPVPVNDAVKVLV